jgi:hypothetical protein
MRWTTSTVGNATVKVGARLAAIAGKHIRAAVTLAEIGPLRQSLRSRAVLARRCMDEMLSRSPSMRH